MIKWDDWQLKFLETKGDKILCTGRQVGKTEVCGEDCRLFTINTDKKGIILMTAPQEFQANILFSKTLSAFEERSPELIMRGKNRPTKTEIKISKDKRRIKNKKPDIIIICKTASNTGIGLRGITTIRNYIDECAQMSDMCWEAIDPQNLVTGGDTIYISTPFGMKGRFYECWINKDNAYNSFKRFSINSEECIKNRKISETWTELMKQKALEKIDRARKRMTHKQFMQEYMGEFIEDLMQWFPDTLIRARQNRERIGVEPSAKYYLGVDVGGRGGSETAFSVFKKEGKRLIHVENVVKNYEKITDTERMIIHLDNRWRFRKVYIDTGGMGVGVFDHLLENNHICRRIEAIDNSTRNISPSKMVKTSNKIREKEPQKRTLMKNDLYNNLLCLMERGEVSLLKDPNIFQSLKSVQFEITENKDIKIFGNYTHIAEALIRAAWCIKDKSLKLWVR